MRAFIAIIALGVAAVAMAQNPPRVLLGQLQILDDSGKDLAIPVATSLGRELDEDGRVEPVVWSARDARFASLALSADWRAPIAPDSLASLLEAGARFKATYVAFMSAARHQGQVIGQIQLFRDGKEVWRDGKTLTASVGGTTDWNVAADTLARTWAQLLFQGPFERLPKRPRVDTPAPDPGPRVIPERGPETAPPTDDALLEARRLIRQNLRTEAVLRLRAAIDARPFDLELRSAAAQIMLDADLANEAANEASRTAALAPEQAGLRLLAARAWLQAGEPAKARAELNEALARDATSVQARLIQGEVLAATGAFEEALTAFAAARDLGDAYEARIGQGFALAMLQRGDQARSMLQGLLDPGQATRESAFRRWTARLDHEFDALATELTDIQRLVRARRNDAALKTRAQAALERAGGFATFAAALEPLPAHKTSHGRRALAHQLLAQAAAETQAFVQGDADAGAECSITLSEATKQHASMRQQWELEATAGP